MSKPLRAGVCCPDCGFNETTVLETRGARRRRKCDSCGHRYNTIEMLVADIESVSDARDKIQKFASMGIALGELIRSEKDLL